MKKYLFFLASVFLFHTGIAQTNQNPDDTVVTYPTFPSEHAQKEKAKANTDIVTKEKGKKRLFRGIIIVGGNFTQIDGDHQNGFSKAGANVGGGLMVNLPKKFSVSMELLYSMKGARGSTDDYAANGYTHTIILDYIDLGLMVNYRLLPYLMFSMGLIPDVLVRSEDYFPIPSTNNNGVPINYNGFRNFGMDGAIGITGILKDHWALNFRWQYSIVIIDHIFPDPANGYFNPYDGQMRHNIISLRGMYIF